MVRRPTVDPAAQARVAALIAGMPLRRDLLIEHLHALQDQVGGLRPADLAALAQIHRIPTAEVFEVASFYHHFTLLKDDAPTPIATIRVCDSVTCMLAGAEQRLAELTASAPPGVRVEAASCLGRCHQAPVVWDSRAVAALPLPNLTAYREAGGFAEHDPDSVIATLKAASLRGLGGAGFPTARKWAFVRDQPGPRLMTLNADEGEPGTFKDWHVLATAPYQVLDGAVIAARTVGAERIYLYLRDEYPDIRLVLSHAIAELEAAGIGPPIELRRGAGAYICGEESAMIESIEGKRGLPRQRPPLIAEAGLFGRPTLNHNVETLYWVPAILQRGAAWFADQGKPGHPGPRLYSVSGRVAHPGVIQAPAGSTAAELIARAGGMAPGHQLAAFLPGGASGGVLPAAHADRPLDFGVLEDLGAFVGSHALVVLSDQDRVRATARNLLQFFERESCGQCTPCRSGTAMLATMLADGPLDPALVADLDQVMRDASICGLGQAAPNPVRSLLRFFGEEGR